VRFDSGAHDLVQVNCAEGKFEPEACAELRRDLEEFDLAKGVVESVAFGEDVGDSGGADAFPLLARWFDDSGESSLLVYPTTNIVFRKSAESAAWRTAPWAFAILAFDGARSSPILAWRLLSSVGFAVRFVATARLSGFGTSQARSRMIICSCLGLRCP